MYNFKDGDVIVRVYESGFLAIGLYQLTQNNFIYLGDSVRYNGGLTQFDVYGLGLEYLSRFSYRLATDKEKKDIILKIINLYNNIENDNDRYYYKKLLNKISDSKKIIRNYKLKKINL